MEFNELTLSDVHVGKYKQGTMKSKKDYSVFVSRFEFISCDDDPDDTETLPAGSTQLLTDEDGDMIVAGMVQRNVKHDVIYIEHAMVTRLEDVGLQVWAGSLLLCDFILAHRHIFSGVTALELGAGLGLVSITLATLAKCVFCTDAGHDILSLCLHNVEINKGFYIKQTLGPSASSRSRSQMTKSPCHPRTSYDGQNELQDTCIINVRQLDWSASDPLHDESCGEFFWSEDDRKLVNDATVFLAADVIYDNKITDEFFKTALQFLCQSPHRTLYMALERRLNYTLEDMDVSCPAYSHFLSWVERCSPDGSTDVIAAQLPTDFPQSFNYDRTKYLELWKFES